MRIKMQQEVSLPVKSSFSVAVWYWIEAAVWFSTHLCRFSFRLEAKNTQNKRIQTIKRVLDFRGEM